MKIFNFKKKNLALVMGVLILSVVSVSAIWIYFGYRGMTSAVIQTPASNPMIIVQDLEDFGILDYSNPSLNLTQKKQFIVESPYGSLSTSYNVTWEIERTLTDLNCTYNEGEIEFQIWKLNGYGDIGELINGGVIRTANNDVAGDSIYEVRMIAVSHAVCPAQYDLSINFD